MPIDWRPATLADLEPCLQIEPRSWGDSLVGREAANSVWRQMVCSPFFASAVLVAEPPIRGHRLIGFGAAVVVTGDFADGEIAHPSPDINSRLIAALHCGSQPILATRKQVASSNAGLGIDVLVLFGNWRDNILTPAERANVQMLFPTSFAEWLSGHRIRRIIHEPTNQPAYEFAQRSVVYRLIAEFPQLGRSIHVMNRDSVEAVPASIGNVIFNFREPLLKLRESDQQLLLAALNGATDHDLAEQIGITFAAVKARWRSTFARIQEAIPGLINDMDDHEGRGLQKRHRVLAYLRNHMEELRPYDWQQENISRPT